MGLLTELRRSITRLWGRTEQAVGEAYGNEALEYEGEADEAKVDAEEAGDAHQHERRHGEGHGQHSHGQHSYGRSGDDASDPDDDGTAATPARR